MIPAAKLTEENAMGHGKDALRHAMRESRANIADADRAHAAERAAAHALAHCEKAGFGTVAIYSPIRAEMDTAPLAGGLIRAGITVVYPRVVKGQRQLQFHRIDGGGELSDGSFGVLEPPSYAPVVPLHNIDAFIIPGLAFDRSGNRLGWGRAHYDATLKQNTNALRIGYAFDCQVIDHVPAGPHDVPMHVVATDSGLVTCRWSGDTPHS